MFTTSGYIMLAFIIIVVTAVYVYDRGIKGHWWAIALCTVALVFLGLFCWAGIKQERSEINALKEAGYDDGYDAGYYEGYDDGYGDGESSGYEDGYEDGYTGGKADGYGEGYTDGCTDTEYDMLNP